MTYNCPKCGQIKSVYSNGLGKVMCDCGSEMKRTYTIASSRASTAKETRCDVLNVKVMDGLEGELKERSAEHYWNVLVPEFVNSGKYPLFIMLEKGWVYYDDKGNLQIQTTPPHRR